MHQTTYAVLCMHDILYTYIYQNTYTWYYTDINVVLDGLCRLLKLYTDVVDIKDSTRRSANYFKSFWHGFIFSNPCLIHSLHRQIDSWWWENRYDKGIDLFQPWIIEWAGRFLIVFDALRAFSMNGMAFEIIFRISAASCNNLLYTILKKRIVCFQNYPCLGFICMNPEDWPTTVAICSKNLQKKNG